VKVKEFDLVKVLKRKNGRRRLHTYTSVIVIIINIIIPRC